jgi:15-cis-phytoene synthase
MKPEEYCQHKAVRQGTSLYYSLLFLPEKQRQIIAALYAYQKEIGEIAAECTEISIAQTKLQWWREEIDRLFAGRPRHPVTQALVAPVKTYCFPQESFLRVIEGVDRDLGQFTYPSFSALCAYCAQIGGSISSLASKTYGYQEPATRQYAENFGIASQLIRVLRNIRQDADRGRIYLPQDEMARFRITPQDILTGQGGIEGIGPLLIQQADRIRHHFHQALAMLNAVDRYSQRAGLIQIAIQLKTLAVMEEDGYQVLQRRVSLTPLHKLWIAWRTARRAQRGQLPCL